MPSRFPIPFVAALSLACVAHASAEDAATYAFGAGVQRMPSWLGSNDHRNQPLPYVDIDLPGVGELSTADGLTLDLIHGERWHGGFYGNYLWGRTRDGLNELGGKVRSLSPRLQAGGYVEYQASPSWSLGSRLSHDTSGPGAYLDVYADWQLPKIGYIEHSLEWQWTGVNAGAMRRFFGVSPDEAAAIGTAAYRPGAGVQTVSIEYDAFVPTSEHTGFALAINYGRLQGNAASSPLVRRYGSRDQLSQTLAFVYHF